MSPKTYPRPESPDSGLVFHTFCYIRYLLFYVRCMSAMSSKLGRIFWNSKKVRVSLKGALSPSECISLPFVRWKLALQYLATRSVVSSHKGETVFVIPPVRCDGDRNSINRYLKHSQMVLCSGTFLCLTVKISIAWLLHRHRVISELYAEMLPRMQR